MASYSRHQSIRHGSKPLRWKKTMKDIDTERKWGFVFFLTLCAAHYSCCRYIVLAGYFYVSVSVFTLESQVDEHSTFKQTFFNVLQGIWNNFWTRMIRPGFFLCSGSLCFHLRDPVEIICWLSKVKSPGTWTYVGFYIVLHSTSRGCVRVKSLFFGWYCVVTSRRNI